MSDLVANLRTWREMANANAAHPAYTAELCSKAAVEIERLRRKVALLHDATIILRNALAGHRTVEQHRAYGEAMRKMDQVAALNSPQEFVDGVLNVFGGDKGESE